MFLFVCVNYLKYLLGMLFICKLGIDITYFGT